MPLSCKTKKRSLDGLSTPVSNLLSLDLTFLCFWTSFLLRMILIVVKSIIRRLVYKDKWRHSTLKGNQSDTFRVPNWWENFQIISHSTSVGISFEWYLGAPESCRWCFCAGAQPVPLGLVGRLLLHFYSSITIWHWPTHLTQSVDTTAVFNWENSKKP